MHGNLPSALSGFLVARTRCALPPGCYCRRRPIRLARCLAIAWLIAAFPSVCLAQAELQSPTGFNFRQGDVKLLGFEAGPISITCSRPDLCATQTVGNTEKMTKIGVLLVAQGYGEADVTIATATDLFFYRLKISNAASDEVPGETKATNVTLKSGERQLSPLEPGFVVTYSTLPDVCETSVLGRTETKRGILLFGRPTYQVSRLAHLVVATPNVLELFAIQVVPK